MRGATSRRGPYPSVPRPGCLSAVTSLTAGQGRSSTASPPVPKVQGDMGDEMRATYETLVELLDEEHENDWSALLDDDEQVVEVDGEALTWSMAGDLLSA